jgi:ABC-type multidrug transport system fused ATPase/permease subunit
MQILLRFFRQGAREHPVHWAVLTLLSLMLAALWVAEPLFSSYAVDQLLSPAGLVEGQVESLILIWGGLFVAFSIVQACEKYLQWKVSMMLELSLVRRAYRHLLHLPVAFHAGQKTGEAMKAIDDGGTELAYLHRMIIDLVPSLLTALTFLIISIQIQPILAGILFFAMVLYAIVVLFGTMKMSVKQDRANRSWLVPSGRAFDAAMNIFAVKSNAREQNEVTHMHRLQDESMTLQLQVNRGWALIEAVHIFLLARILLLAIGILLYARGMMTLGNVYYFQLSFFRALVPFEMLAGFLPQWAKSLGKVKIVAELMDRPTEDAELIGQERLPAVKGAIQFHNVSFRYVPHEAAKLFVPTEHAPVMNRPPACEEEELCPKNAAPGPRPASTPIAMSQEPTTVDALQNVNLDIKPGEHIAFVGHSGAGKSTIAMLLCAFYHPTAGSITIDGHDLKSLDPRWWRGRVGLVLQENLLFHDTIRANIGYGREDASEEEVIDAAKRAAAHEFIEKLSGGYDTIVGERGIKLSGGQRQRLAIARAILKTPEIVVLDEATSALDSITEREVQHGISELIAGRTAIIIAHRLSTVRSVDRIAVLDAGRLVACAPHEELLKTCDVYRTMVELQSGGMLAE